MGLWMPAGAGDFTWMKFSHDTTRPTTSTLGTSVTPGNNTKGSYASVLSSGSVISDVFGMLINFNGTRSGAAARDIIADIGVDPAGGTSYSVLIPDLLASCACFFVEGVGISYYFPIWVKSGSSIACRASVNNATVGTIACNITVFGKPRDPKSVKVGTSVTAYGITSASSSGTAVTSGTTGEGSWTSIATTTKDHWWWQQGMGVNDTTMTANNVYALECAFGDASNKHIIVPDQYWYIPTSNEGIANYPSFAGSERYVPSGTNLYGRMQCSGTADSALSMAIYGVR